MRIIQSFVFIKGPELLTEYSLDEFIVFLQKYNPPDMYVSYCESEELLETVRGILYTLGIDIDLVFNDSLSITYSFYEK